MNLKPIAALAAAALLAGCATLNAVDSDVSSFSQWPADRKPGRFAFERLPSQQANNEQQGRLEDAARGALGNAGFSEATAPADAEVTVQLGARATRYDRSPWDDPFWRLHVGRGWGYHPRTHIGLGLHYTSPRYEREVAVLIRDRKTGAPLYESRASTDSGYNDGAALLAAMFDAALKDFPQPAVNPRRVSVPLPAAQ